MVPAPLLGDMLSVSNTLSRRRCVERNPAPLLHIVTATVRTRDLALLVIGQRQRL